eukprot:TRINITY_DN1578_c0_g2_i5.p1 TRINITY_DN1578_c0_g2~~TRINITY_DN1578_c0_g2_i5.p1  ORF type:complete len:196 (-),score=31.75 TRINITY_DN1578_c0_g2_i5:87-674(-)
MDMGGGSVLEFLDRIDPVDTGQGAPPGLQPIFNPPPTEQAPTSQPQHPRPQAPPSPPAPPSTATTQQTQTSRHTRLSELKGPQGRARRRQGKINQKKRQKQNRREADRVEDTPPAQPTPAPAPTPSSRTAPSPSPSPSTSTSTSTPPDGDPVVCAEGMPRYLRRKCTRFTPIIVHRITRSLRCCSSSMDTHCLEL